jgi:hypothetical protein
MKKLLHINLKTIVLALSCVFVLTSCEDDEDEIFDLKLEKTTIEVTEGDNATVKIESGNGGYTVSSSSAATATAAVSGEAITVTGVKAGQATITLKDKAGKSASLAVTVKSAYTIPSATQFVWDGTKIELDKVNNWSTTILFDRYAVTSIADKKQYVIAWSGGLTVGDKTAATLKIAADGQQTQTVSLTKLTVVQAESNSYYVVFNKDTQKGELYFSK